MANLLDVVASKISEGYPASGLLDCFGVEVALHLIMTQVNRNACQVPPIHRHPCDEHLDNLYLTLLGESHFIETWLLPRMLEWTAKRDRIELTVHTPDRLLNPPHPLAWFIKYCK